MEWGNFLIVIVAIYVAWYGLNFLYDLFIGSGPKPQIEASTHYNIRDLAANEEPATIINEADYEEKMVDVRPTPIVPISSDTSTGDGPAQNLSDFHLPALGPTAVEYPTDWASEIDQEEQIIEIPVQGQPLSVSDFLKTLKDEAKTETATISF